MGITSPFIRRVFCRHASVEFVRNIHGDEINVCGGKRSVWRCQRCGASVLRADLHPTPRPAPPPTPPRRSYATQATTPSTVVASSDDMPMSMHGLSSHRSESSPEPDRFVSGGGGDFGGGGASGSWGDSSSCGSSSSSSDSGSSSSDSSSSCSSD